MKKALTLVLAIALVFSLSAVAFAHNEMPNYEKEAAARQQYLSDSQISPRGCLIHSWRPWKSGSDRILVYEYTNCYYIYQFEYRGCTNCNEVQVRNERRTYYRHKLSGYTCSVCGVIPTR